MVDYSRLIWGIDSVLRIRDGAQELGIQLLVREDGGNRYAVTLFAENQDIAKKIFDDAEAETERLVDLHTENLKAHI